MDFGCSGISDADFEQVNPLPFVMEDVTSYNGHKGRDAKKIRMERDAKKGEDQKIWLNLLISITRGTTFSM